MVLARWQRTITDDEGNVLPAAQITVRREATGTPLATLYSNRGGTTPIANPFAADSEGFAAFHVAGGAYQITATSGAFSRTWRYVAIGLAAESDALSSGLRYLFSSSTTDADPGAGYLRFNNATLASVTAMYIDLSTVDGLDLTTYLDSLDDGGSSSNRGTIVVDQAANGAFFVGTVTGSVTSASGYRKLAVTPIATIGTFVADAATNFSFNRSGTDGASATRSALSANRTYYVRTDGSDSNTGLVDSAGGAFLTVQKAIDVIFGTLDLAGFDVDIQLRTGTFGRALITAPQVGKGKVTIRGDSATPANTIMNASAIGEPAGVIEAQNFATLYVRDLTLTCSTTGSGMMARNGGIIYLVTNVRFGACASYHMHAASGSYIEIQGNYSIVGAAQVHIRPGSLSEIRYAPVAITVTISGTPAFSAAFVQAYILGVAANLGTVTWSGSATGKRFDVFENSDINGASLTGLPGDVAGTINSGGQFSGGIKHTIWIPASAMVIDSGPSSGKLNVGGAIIPYIAFDATTQEYVFFNVAMPKGWDEGTLTAVAYWTHPATVTNFGVVWNISLSAFGDNDALNNTYVGANSTDTGGTTSNLYVSPETSTIDAGNTQAENDLLLGFVSRATGDGSDTMAVDAYLIGIKLFYTTNSDTDF